MKRNLNGLKESYEKRHLGVSTSIYASDIRGIMEGANGDLYQAIVDALEIGIEIGLRDSERKAKATKTA